MRARSLRMGMSIVAGAMILAGASQMVRADDGKAVFDKNCALCHGAGGKGDGPAGKALKPPPGDFATTLKGVSDADITTLISEGKAMGKSHTAYGKKLSEDQIKAVVQYAKGLAAK